MRVFSLLCLSSLLSCTTLPPHQMIVVGAPPDRILVFDHIPLNQAEQIANYVKERPIIQNTGTPVPREDAENIYSISLVHPESIPSCSGSYFVDVSECPASDVCNIRKLCISTRDGELKIPYTTSLLLHFDPPWWQFW